MNKYAQVTIQALVEAYPYLNEHFEKNGIDVVRYQDHTVEQMVDALPVELKEDYGLDAYTLLTSIEELIDLMKFYLEEAQPTCIEMTLLAGVDKQGNPETFAPLHVKAGEILSIVGPTGSGKSRLLADIEWAAQADTPTQRTVLINGAVVDVKERFNVGNKLVAQLSQNMNFIMDVSVYEFLELHAISRLVPDKERVIATIFEKANELAGERFSLETPVTSLSGGQSRALMIADTAYLSKSPIILIDEIENAGIDRRKALELLVAKDKIVLMSTHDPILALMATKRIVINNGAIVQVLETSEQEKGLLQELEQLDTLLQRYRQDLRYGKRIERKEM
ncbi:MAG: ATP-binding cassette domain-containing protein [Erysipelotrichaceae bacterium]